MDPQAVQLFLLNNASQYQHVQLTEYLALVKLYLRLGSQMVHIQ